MDTDADKPSRRAGSATTPAGPASAGPTTPGFEKALRRRAKPLTAAQFLSVAEWVHAERKAKGLSQRAMAAAHRIPERQIRTYETAAKWPPEAKSFIKSNSSRFGVSELTRHFANRAWRSRETLLNALSRHASGKPPRKRRQNSSGHLATDPDLLAVQDRLRECLKTRVELRGDGKTGELRIGYFSLDDLERLISLLER